MTSQERNAWTAAYRLYDEYAPKLRSASNNEIAGAIFQTISNRIIPIYNAADNGGQLILHGLYDILSNVFKNARRGA